MMVNKGSIYTWKGNKDQFAFYQYFYTINGSNLQKKSSNCLTRLHCFQLLKVVFVDVYVNRRSLLLNKNLICNATANSHLLIFLLAPTGVKNVADFKVIKYLPKAVKAEDDFFFSKRLKVFCSVTRLSC